MVLHSAPEAEQANLCQLVATTALQVEEPSGLFASEHRLRENVQ
jgi:hypothetical protein